MSEKIISLVRDFSRTPGARYRWQGNNSGEEFRERCVLPALKDGNVRLVLDGAIALPPSFLDEVIGVMLENRPELIPRLKIVLHDNPTAHDLLFDSLTRRIGLPKATTVFAPIEEAE